MGIFRVVAGRPEKMANSKEAGLTSVGREVTSLDELTPFEKKNVLYHKISWMFWGFSHRERIMLRSHAHHLRFF